MTAPLVTKFKTRIDMKKIFFAFAALAAITACNKAEVIDVTPDNIIGFNAPFVDNATKSINNDYSGEKVLQGFKVYGTITGNLETVNLFKDVEIVRPEGDNVWGQVWAYKNEADAEYWLPGCTYEFAAIVDGSVETDGYTSTGMPAEINYTVGDGDLLYAKATASTVGTANPGLVEFSFTHLLSKVYFTIDDQLTTDDGDYTYSMTDIKVSGIPASGVYTVGTTVDNGTWAAGTDTIADSDALNFGDDADQDAHLIIPVNQTMNIKFTYDIIFKGTPISTIVVDETLTYTFAQKTVYNINVTLPALGNKIQFTVKSIPGGFTSAGSDINI